MLHHAYLRLHAGQLQKRRPQARMRHGSGDDYPGAWDQLQHNRSLYAKHSMDLCACLFCVCNLTITTLRAQSNNASITGEITDPRGAVIQGAQVTLTSKDTKQTSNYVSDGNGYYSFRNVLPGTYQLTITATGFGQYTQEGILVRVGYPIRQDVQLKLQATAQSVDVAADVSALNYENAELRGSIDPQVIQDVPLLVGGSMRSAANFASILPGWSGAAGTSPGRTSMAVSRRRASPCSMASLCSTLLERRV